MLLTRGGCCYCYDLCGGVCRVHTIDVELARLGCLVGPGKGAGGSGEPLWEELCVGR